MSSKTPIGHSLIVNSRPSSAVDVCDRILSELKEWDFKQEDVFAIHLALEETFINVFPLSGDRSLFQPRNLLGLLPQYFIWFF